MTDTAAKVDVFNWNLPRFMPVEVAVSANGVELKCCGEVVALKGALFKTQSDYELNELWRFEEYLGQEGHQGQKGQNFRVLSLDLTADRQTILHKVSWFAGDWEAYDEKLVHSTALQDNFLFLRKGKISFFLSLDFPSSQINQDGISYEPWDQIAANETYTCHTVSVGACVLSGVKIGDYDRSEIEALSSYIEQRFPQKFERPVTGITCITNGMTDVSEGRIFYSMYDNPTLLLDPDVLEREIDLCAEAGFEYYQVFEGVFDWPDDDTKIGHALRNLVKYGADRGVRVGDYVHPGELYCPHYNYEHRHLDKPEWRQLSADGTRGQLCLGCKDYADFLRDQVVSHNRKYNEQMVCLDMLDIAPCYSTTHNHPKGDVYHQVRGLVDLMVSLAALHPEYLIWSNSGNWLEFMPKLVWYNPNIYLTDPHVREYSPNLNMLKLMGDTRREQMVTFHNTYFVPYRYYSNCEYYFVKRSRVSDLLFFEYSILQGLAVTPNIFMGEWRTFLERIPSGKRAECVAFMKKWLSFIKSNFDVWKHTKQFGDAPSIGGMEAYSHVEKDRGFLCFVNSNPFPGTIRFQLDGSIGLEKEALYDLFEIYPMECPLAEQPLPYAAFGDFITFELPAHSVRYIEIKPYVKPDSLKVLGLPAEITQTEQGYRLLLKAPQGEQVRLGLILPDGEAVEQVFAQQVPTVPMYTFPAAAQLYDAAASTNRNVAQVEVTFPRIKAPRELTNWVMQPGNMEVKLPQMEKSPFLGAIVQGAYSENYEVWLDVVVKQNDPEPSQLEHSDLKENDSEPGQLEHSDLKENDSESSRLEHSDLKENDSESNQLKQNELTQIHALSMPEQDEQLFSGKTHTFETDFDLPFMGWDSFSPGYGDDAVIELAFTDPGRVSEISAAINGEPIEVRRYPYATNKAWYSYYIVLTGNVKLGKLKLSVKIDWVD
ncbi:hypothetical protein [Paenibacillus eucommiae]|uniref:Uncharacterized protein n=1 Tax=Paenibacillus eucommiae TaxID=1355755 RepID=A0ABS4J093_9BACL|nr:hypothetical protein [Paenibacillus eucommiae]MBP1993245.1 hypothetical protein [Paenibacillus eucommiae]